MCEAMKLIYILLLGSIVSSVESFVPTTSMNSVPYVPMRFFLKGYAEQVLRSLGPGHTERVYHNAMITHLNRNNVRHRSEVTCPFYYMDECVGYGTADLVVENMVVELKAQPCVPASGVLQLRKYAEALSKCENSRYHGMLINFNSRLCQVEALLIDKDGDGHSNSD